MDTIKQFIERILVALELKGTGLAEKSLRRLDKTVEALIAAESHITEQLSREADAIQKKREDTEAAIVAKEAELAAAEDAYDARASTLNDAADRAYRVANKLTDLIS